MKSFVKILSDVKSRINSFKETIKTASLPQIGHAIQLNDMKKSKSQVKDMLGIDECGNYRVIDSRGKRITVRRYDGPTNTLIDWMET